jgi:hypothetical protein
MAKYREARLAGPKVQLSLRTSPAELRKWADSLEKQAAEDPRMRNSALVGPIEGDGYELKILWTWQDQADYPE